MKNKSNINFSLIARCTGSGEAEEAIKKVEELHSVEILNDC